MKTIDHLIEHYPLYNWEEIRVPKIKFKFIWYDFWVGFYWDRKTKTLYICPLPMLVIEIRNEKEIPCGSCGSKTRKTAFHTGDGWALQLECTKYECELIAELPWPSEGEYLTTKDLIKLGYELI